MSLVLHLPSVAYTKSWKSAAEERGRFDRPTVPAAVASDSNFTSVEPNGVDRVGVPAASSAPAATAAAPPSPRLPMAADSAPPFEPQYSPAAAPLRTPLHATVLLAAKMPSVVLQFVTAVPQPLGGASRCGGPRRGFVARIAVCGAVRSKEFPEAPFQPLPRLTHSWPVTVCD